MALRTLTVSLQAFGLTPVAGARVHIELVRAGKEAGVLVIPDVHEDRLTDAAGITQFTLWPTDAHARYEAKIYTKNVPRVVKGFFEMPDANANLSDIIVFDDEVVGEVAIIELRRKLTMRGDFNVTTGNGLPTFPVDNDAWRLTNVPTVNPPVVDGRTVENGQTIYYKAGVWHSLGGADFDIEDWATTAATPALPTTAAKNSVFKVTTITGGTSFVLDGKTFVVGDIAVVLALPSTLFRIPASARSATEITTEITEAINAHLAAADPHPQYTTAAEAAAAAPVQSVAGRTGAVVLTKSDVGLANVDNTSDANKPVSTAQADADTATLNNAKAHADGLVVGLLDDRGNYDASGNVFPEATGSGAVLAVPVANAPTTATTGGSLAAATYYYVVTATKSNGETTKSNEVSITTTGTTSTVTVSWGAITGATGYRVYRGTAAGGENVYYSVSGGSTTSFTDTGAANTAGSPPTVNTTGAVLKGDLWRVSVAGTLGGTAVAVNDWFRALSDAPGQTAANWSINAAAGTPWASQVDSTVGGTVVLAAGTTFLDFTATSVSATKTIDCSAIKDGSSVRVRAENAITALTLSGSGLTWDGALSGLYGGEMGVIYRQGSKLYSFGEGGIQAIRRYIIFGPNSSNDPMLRISPLNSAIMLSAGDQINARDLTAVSTYTDTSNYRVIHFGGNSIGAVNRGSASEVGVFLYSSPPGANNHGVTVHSTGMYPTDASGNTSTTYTIGTSSRRWPNAYALRVNLSEGMDIPSFVEVAPAEGATVTPAVGHTVIIAPTAALTAATVNLSNTQVDGREVEILFGPNQINTITWAGNGSPTFVGMPTTGTPTSPVKVRYRASNNTFYKVP